MSARVGAGFSAKHLHYIALAESYAPDKNVLVVQQRTMLSHAAVSQFPLSRLPNPTSAAAI